MKKSYYNKPFTTIWAMLSLIALLRGCPETKFVAKKHNFLNNWRRPYSNEGVRKHVKGKAGTEAVFL